MEHIEQSAITAQLVDDSQRLKFLPRHFDTQVMIFERALYAQLRHLSTDYDGGYWDFYDLSNGGCYCAPRTHRSFRITVPGNGFEGRLDPETTGIVATLFTFSHLSFRFPSTEVYARRFYQLREFALEHREQQLIFAAID